MTEDEARALHQRIADERPTCFVEIHALITPRGHKRWVIWVRNPRTGARIVVVNPADWTAFLSALV